MIQTSSSSAANTLFKTPKTIGVFSPGSWVEKSRIERSAAALEANGITVYIHPQTYSRHHQFAGSSNDKSQAFLDLWDNDDIDIIWCAGGGNRTLNWTLDIDWGALPSKPHKIVIGFSDCTSLLNFLTLHKKCRTIHGPVFAQWAETDDVQKDHLIALMKDDLSSYPLTGAETIQTGQAEGPLIGGNLSIVQYLPSFIPASYWRGTILCLEDCNEELSRLDRTLFILKSTGIFNMISGLILGEFTGLGNTGKPFGMPLSEIIRDHIAGTDIPVLINAPFGHGHRNYAFPMGQNARLNAETKAPPSLQFI